MSEQLGTRSLSDRVVLLGLADLAANGETPAHTGQVTRACSDRLDDIDADVLGSVSEAEVNRALNRLDADGHVAAREDDETSAVGKGRPRFALADDPEAVVEELADDDDVATLATRVRDAL